MHTFSFILSAAIFVSCLSLSSLSLMAESQDSQFDQSALQASAAAAQAWLSLVDRGDYAQSWERASTVMKLTVSKDEWTHILNKVRKPLGNVSSRQVLDQRTATNPQGLPKGDYIVMFYKTAFSGKPAAYELLTLYLEDGQWSVLTYQVN